MSVKTVIKYIINGERKLQIRIINIIPNGDIDIKITFPNNTWSISTNNKVIITQKRIFSTDTINLLINDTILGIKNSYYNEGTIIITGECTYEESYYDVYDA